MYNGFETVETCLLLSPGVFSVTHEFLIDTIALGLSYPQTGKTIVLYVDGKKYIEKLEAQCFPYCKLTVGIRLLPKRFTISDKISEIYAAGDIYLCGKEFRRSTFQ